MSEIFNVILSQITVLFLFIALGFWLKKSGKLSETMSKGLSVLEINIFIPLLNISVFSKNFKLDVISQKIPTVISAVIVLAVMLVLGIITAKLFTKTPLERDVYVYAMTLRNITYIGYPITLAALGEAAAFDFMVFSVPILIFTFSVGIYILNPSKKFSLKNLLNLPMLSMFAGMILGLLNLNFPPVVTTFLETGSGCMAPVGMILTGIVFASGNLKTMMCNIKIYVVCFIKLVIIPIVVICILKLINLHEYTMFAIITNFALPAGINTIVFPEAFGGDSRSGAQICFISTVMSIITMPIIYAIYNFVV